MYKHKMEHNKHLMLRAVTGAREVHGAREQHHESRRGRRPQGSTFASTLLSIQGAIHMLTDAFDGPKGPSNPPCTDVWGKPMTLDEQQAKSVRYTYGALVVPLESGAYGVFTKFHEFMEVCNLHELPAAIKKAADHGFNMKKQVEYETRYAKNFKRSSLPATETGTIPGTRPSPVNNNSGANPKVVSDLSQLGF